MSESVDLGEAANQSNSVWTRRGFLTACGAAAALSLSRPALAIAPEGGARALRFNHLHTGETLHCTYWAEGCYQPEALSSVNHLLRDFRTGEVRDIDPAVLDILFDLQNLVGSEQPFDIISAYRSPATNQMLRQSSGGVAKKSLHMQGRAIDVRLPGVDLKQQWKAARSLRAGGVGYYPNSGFLHVDTGRVRHWQG